MPCSPHPCPPLRLSPSRFPPLPPAESRRQAGDPLGFLSLPAQRSALQRSPLAPGEESQFFSAWEKPCNEVILPEVQRKQQSQGVRGKKTQKLTKTKNPGFLEEGHSCNQNEKELIFRGDRFKNISTSTTPCHVQWHLSF